MEIELETETGCQSSKRRRSCVIDGLNSMSRFCTGFSAFEIGFPATDSERFFEQLARTSITSHSFQSFCALYASVVVSLPPSPAVNFTEVFSIGTRPFMNDLMFQRWKLQQPSGLRLRPFMNDHICLNTGADHHEGWPFMNDYVFLGGLRETQQKKEGCS